jgi:hypothetical protein
MPDPNINPREDWPWHKQKCRHEILAAIKRIVDGELSIVDGCWALDDLLTKLWPYYGDYGHPDFEVCASVCRDTYSLPVGEVRKFWAKDALLIKDKEIARVEDLHRDEVLSWGLKMLNTERTKS